MTEKELRAKVVSIAEKYLGCKESNGSHRQKSSTSITVTWYYEIVNRNGSAKITFYNSNIQNGVPIAIILQYGHGTRNGGWVQGRDYINPAIQPIFDKIANNAWKEVTKL